MRMPEILSLVALYITSQQYVIAATEFPWAALRASEGGPVVVHKTTKGTIMCRDPQINFDPEKCSAELKVRTFGGSLPEHMLVDMVVNKRLLGKQESYLDSVLPSKQDIHGTTLYSISPSHQRLCGSVPFGYLQVAFDDNHAVVKYRAKHYTDPSANISVESDWVYQTNHDVADENDE